MLYCDREVLLSRTVDTPYRSSVPAYCPYVISLGREPHGSYQAPPCVVGVSGPAAEVLGANPGQRTYRDLSVEDMDGSPVIVAIDEEDIDERDVYLFLSSAYQYRSVNRYCNAGHVLASNHLYAAGDGLLAMGVGHGYAMGGGVFSYDVVLLKQLCCEDVFYVSCGGTGKECSELDDYIVFAKGGKVLKMHSSNEMVAKAIRSDPVLDRFGKLDLLACGFRRVQPAVAD